MKEAQSKANVGVHGTDRVSFTVTKAESGKYRVFINGLRGRFYLVENR